MPHYAASDLKSNIGAIFQAANHSPVRISKRGTRGFVIMSEEKYAALEALEDKIWGERALEALRGGTVGADNAEKLLTGLLTSKS